MRVMPRSAHEVDELRSLTRLAFEELRDATGGVHGFHQTIACRAFGASGPGAVPARTLHDAIAAGVYGGIGGVTRLLGLAAETGVASRPERDARSLSTSPRGALVLGVLNGLIGDRLEEEDSDLQEPMSVRVNGRPIEPDAAAVAASFPDATPRLVVFLHGLMESEFAWRIGAGPAGATYGSRLRDELG